MTESMPLAKELLDLKDHQIELFAKSLQDLSEIVDTYKEREKLWLQLDDAYTRRDADLEFGLRFSDFGLRISDLRKQLGMK
jgi:hypothetical protein